MFHISYFMLQTQQSIDKMAIEAHEVAMVICAIAAVVIAINVFDIYSFASPGALLGFGFGGLIGVVGFAFGPVGGFTGIVIGLLLGSFIGSGMYKLGETLSYQVGRANEERLIAALQNSMSRITGQSKSTEEN